jgi:hypothetical protein
VEELWWQSQQASALPQPDPLFLKLSQDPLLRQQGTGLAVAETMRTAGSESWPFCWKAFCVSFHLVHHTEVVQRMCIS